MEHQDSFSDFITGISTPGMIKWEDMPTYNTIMALAAGVGLILVAFFIYELLQSVKNKKPLNTDSFALAFAVSGIIQFCTGLHMTLTWPLAKGGFAYDNIIFGETTLPFGVLLLVAAFYLWKRGKGIGEAENPLLAVAQSAKPVSIFIGALGLELFAITMAGLIYRLYAAPVQEPISGFFSPYPWFEAIFLSVLFFLAGLGAFLTPIAAFQIASGKTETSGISAIKTSMVCWAISGVAFMLFGAMNFYTHIGFILNTI